MKRGLLLIPLFFFVLLVETVYAPNTEIDITQFDDLIGEALGIGAFAGGLLISCFLILLFLGMLGGAMKRRPSNLITLVMVISVSSLCIAVGWFPAWTLIVEVLLIALLFGSKLTRSWGD